MAERAHFHRLGRWLPHREARGCDEAAGSAAMADGTLRRPIEGSALLIGQPGVCVPRMCHAHWPFVRSSRLRPVRTIAPQGPGDGATAITGAHMLLSRQSGPCALVQPAHRIRPAMPVEGACPAGEVARA